MAIRMELNVRIANSPGALAAVCRILADERVNITALSLDPGGQLRLVVDNHVRAAGALREAHHPVTERPVIVTALAAAPGSLAPVLALLADAGHNLDYVYGSVAESARTAGVVIGVADAERAAAAAGV